MFQLV